MSRSITGNTKGLAKSDLRRLDKLFSRKVNREEIVSLDLAREVYQLGSDLRRKLGVLVSREGQVEEVMVGTKELLYLPDLGRYRLGPARLRRLRLVFSDLSKRSEPFIPTDIYTDLEKLRLDMVIAVKVLPPNYRVQVAYAHIVPSLISDQPAVRTERVNDLGRLELNFEEYMQGLEEELSQVAQGSAKVGKLKALLVGVYGKDGSQAQSSLDELTEL
ncbi:MAG: GTPase HflX, partial [Proteobacteria bacterium]